MRAYYQLNKHKIPYAIGLIWLVFFILSLVPVFASYRTSTTREIIQSLVLCLLVTGILAILILGLSFLSALSEFQSRSKKFASDPWQTVFHQYGFEPHLVRVK